MNSPTGHPCTRSARRNTIAAAAAAALLAVLALGADPSRAAEDPSTGGVAAPAMDQDFAAAEEAIDALPGEAEAPAEAPVPTPVPAPEPAPPDIELPAVPSTEAPAPPPPEPAAPPVGEPEHDGGVAAPVNLNIDVRVLSPGDDGDVSQEVIVDAPAGDGSEGVTVVFDWDWDWDWHWHGSPGELPEEVLDQLPDGFLDELPDGFRGELPDELLEPLSAEEPAAPARPPGPGPPAATQPAGHEGGVPVPETSPRPPPAGAGAALTLAQAAPPAALPLATAPRRVVNAPQARSRAAASDRGVSGGGGLAPALPSVSVAGSVAPPAGSSSVLLVVLLAALCLLAPRTGERAWTAGRRLRSLIRSQRLERPG